jgi:hypothetical protein
MRLYRRFPVWTLALTVIVLSVYYGHGALTVYKADSVLVEDHGLFVIANAFPGNVSVPVADGTIMSTLHPGNWGNWWTVNATDHMPHTVNFQVHEQGTSNLYTDYNATISGDAVVFIDLGSSQINDFYATVSWT